jgi:hypothetical protein
LLLLLPQIIIAVNATFVLCFLLITTVVTVFDYRQQLTFEATAKGVFVTCVCVCVCVGPTQQLSNSLRHSSLYSLVSSLVILAAGARV